MKKINVIIIMMLFFYIGIAFASDFEFSNGIITRYTGSNNVVKIPSYIYNSLVEAIGEGAFAENRMITYVSIPNSVKQVGTGAFFKCSSLTEVTMEDSVESIGDVAFVFC